jgi:hypothetical protein
VCVPFVVGRRADRVADGNRDPERRSGPDGHLDATAGNDDVI